MIQVTINGRLYAAQPEMTYEQLITSAKAHPQATIVYLYKHVCDHGRHDHSGILTAGQTLRMVDGMILNIIYTGNA